MTAMSAVATSVPAMTAMHEPVQEGTGQKQQKRQPAQSVDPVLAEKEEQGNARKGQEHQHVARPFPVPISHCAVTHLLPPIRPQSVPATMMQEDASMTWVAK